MRKKTSILFLIILAIAATAVFVLARNPTSPLGVNPATNDDRMPADFSQASTANWAIYRNEEFGFEFSYPNDWQLIVGPKESREHFSVFLTEEDVKSNFWIIPGSVARQSVFDIGAGVQVFPIQFDDRGALKYSCPGNNKCPSQLSEGQTVTILDLPLNWKEGNEIGFVIYHTEESVSPIFEEVLAQFKFLDMP